MPISLVDFSKKDPFILTFHESNHWTNFDIKKKKICNNFGAKYQVEL